MRSQSCSPDLALVVILLTILCTFLPEVALAQPSIVSFQGQLAEDGIPFDGEAQFKFVVLCRGTSAWSNDGSSMEGSEPSSSVTLAVDRGVFSVLLGDPDLSMPPLTSDLLDPCLAEAVLRIWVRTENTSEQLPDQPLGSSPFALRADFAERAIGTFEVSGSLVLRNESGTATISGAAATGQVQLTSIRFADGTVQTTAGAGGPVDDGDWNVVGDDLHSAVSGNVGIGTTTPTERLEVNGTTLIQGDLTVQGAINVNGAELGSGVLSIPPSAFQPRDSEQRFDRNREQYAGTQAGQSVVVEAPLLLPHGARIVLCTVVMTDNATSGNIATFFARQPLSGASGQIFASLSTDGTPGRVSPSQVTNHVVDNVNNVYNVTATWITPPAGQEDALRMHGIVIHYE